MLAAYSIYFFIRGGAIIFSIFFGISNNLHLFLIPNFFNAGDTAKHIVLSVLVSSATTRFVVIGSKFLSAHSTDAKKDFISITK